MRPHRWIANGTTAILRKPYGMCAIYTEAALNDTIDRIRKDREKYKSEDAYLAELGTMLDGLQVFAKEKR